MAGTSASPCIGWFRDDLRLSDHPALHAASTTQRPVICLYVLDETSARALGGAARWWLAQSLRALQARLASVGCSLVLRKGPAAEIIAALARETGPGTVFWNEIAHAPQKAVAGQVAAALEATGVASQSFPGDLLAPPTNIRNKDGRGFRVFTPFWRRVLAVGDPPELPPAPKTLRPPAGLLGDPLDSWRLEPAHPDWADGLRQSWTPGELSGQQRLGNFLATGVADYARGRDRPDRDGTSRLSPHLRFGEVSAAGLARRGLCRRRPPRACRRYRQVPERARLARILPSPAVRRAEPGRPQRAGPLRRLSVAARPPGAAGVATRPDRLSDRRCRDARTLAHRGHA